jgi:hypothetical protein
MRLYVSVFPRSEILQLERPDDGSRAARPQQGENLDLMCSTAR